MKKGTQTWYGSDKTTTFQKYLLINTEVTEDNSGFMWDGNKSVI